jgi:hypothetical protein
MSHSFIILVTQEAENPVCWMKMNATKILERKRERERERENE